MDGKYTILNFVLIGIGTYTIYAPTERMISISLGCFVGLSGVNILRMWAE